MSAKLPPVTFGGRYLGVAVLVAAQVLIGLVHVVFGFWMLAAPRFENLGFFSNAYLSVDIYSVYTVVFGVLSLVFSVGLWLQMRWGWVGTSVVLVFVVVADSLTLLDLPSVPGIPKFAGYGEITYSVIVLSYLLQSHIRAKYGIQVL
jgi:hypothetical protein